MMAKAVRAFAVIVSSVVLLFATSQTARADLCIDLLPIKLTSVTSTILSPYDPFTGADATLQVGITISNTFLSLLCRASVSFTRTAGLPASMSQGSDTLQYTIQSTGGATLLQTTGFVQGSSPAQANRIDVMVPALGSVTVNAIIRVPGGQVVAAGSYTDPQVTLLLSIHNNLFTSTPQKIAAQRAFVPAISVVAKCVLPAPSASTLDFTTAITHGVPNSAIVKSTQFTDVQCTAPSILRLSGSAMQPAVGTPPQTGFNNFINWQAVGLFGNASSTLNTGAATQANSSAKNVASGATSQGTINVDVNLLSGSPIISGSYSGTLTVTIDPNL